MRNTRSAPFRVAVVFEINEWIDLGHQVNRKKVQRLMQLMRIKALYPKPSTNKRSKKHKIYLYILRNLAITRPDQVWATGIT